eukprot:scaffold136612_cov18-Tisochrysis_lutea.AAC.1
MSANEGQRPPPRRCFTLACTVAPLLLFHGPLTSVVRGAALSASALLSSQTAEPTGKTFNHTVNACVCTAQHQTRNHKQPHRTPWGTPGLGRC